MTHEENVSECVYAVVVNHEEEYSIWLADQSVPAGWREVGVCGSRRGCFDHIREVLTDMRLLSRRRQVTAALIARGHLTNVAD